MEGEAAAPRRNSGDLDLALEGAVSAAGDEFLTGGNELTIDHIHSLSSARGAKAGSCGTWVPPPCRRRGGDRAARTPSRRQHPHPPIPRARSRHRGV